MLRPVVTARKLGSLYRNCKTVGDREYGVTWAVKLVNEIPLSFIKGPYFDYIVENFGELAA